MRLKTLFASSALATVSAFAIATPAQAQIEPFIGQVSSFGFNFCPRGWTQADGKLLPIASNTALFSLLGTYYGGDGRTTFAVPDLRGRAPVGDGDGPGIGSYPIGSVGGTTSFTLSIANMPAHNHTGTIGASTTAADSNIPVRNSFAAATNGANVYLDGNPATNNMHPDTLRINPTGGNQPVSKVSPYTTLRWCVATQGIFPSRS